MKITRSYLQRVIQEELEKALLNEVDRRVSSVGDVKAAYKAGGDMDGLEAFASAAKLYKYDDNDSVMIINGFKVYHMPYDPEGAKNWWTDLPREVASKL